MQKDIFGNICPSVKRSRRKIPPPVEGSWTAPREFPNLSNAEALTVDVETYDPNLKTQGPGWVRNDGHLVGVGVGVDTKNKWYFPMRHEAGMSENLNPVHVLSWLKDTLCSAVPKIGANLIYDVGWLEHEGVKVNGPLFDVQYAEALLSDDRTVSLDSLGERYLNERKASDDLYTWCSEMFGGTAKDQRKNIYKTPPRIVGPYGEGDVDLPYRILPLQIKKLKELGLYKLFLRENKLIKILLAMRKQGVQIDIDRAEQMYKLLTKRIRKKQKRLNNFVGVPVNVEAARSLARAFDKLNLPYGVTEKSKEPSFTKSFLETCDHEIATRVIEIRELTRLADVFIKSYLLESSVNGKVYCQFHPLRSDSGGTRTGRFSSSTPNLQNIPSRTDLGMLIRSLFVPFDGHKQWRKQDASQIEYRFFAHFAVGEGSENIRRAYRKNPKTDYHIFVQQLIKKIASVILDRGPTKNINFGFLYGMGEAKTAKDLELTRKRASALFDAYHRSIPFARATMDACVAYAEKYGYITTIKGRRLRFKLYEPAEYSEDKKPALPKKRALLAYGSNIKRAFTYKALNAKLQGSAAELMKEGMIQCDEQGLFKEVGYPVLTVHDELNFSDPGGKNKYFKEVIKTCEQAIKISVPIIIDEDIGPSWGELK